MSSASQRAESAARGGSAFRLAFTIYVDFVAAIALGSVLAVIGALVWFATTAPELPAAFWNPLARHVAYELTVPADSPEAATLLSQVDRWLGEHVDSGAAELRTNADGTWLAVVMPREAPDGLGDAAIIPSGIATSTIRLGTSADWMLRLYRDPDGVQTARRLFPLLFASNGFAMLVIGLWRGRGGTRVWESPRAPLSTRVIWGVLGGAVMLVLMVLGEWVFAFVGWEQTEQPIFDAVHQIHGIPFVLTCAAIVGLGPVAEEIFFRRHIFGRLAAVGRPGAAYAASACLFSLAHFHPSAVPSYVASGLILAWLYARTRWIGTAILAHATNNLVALSVLLTA